MTIKELTSLIQLLEAEIPANPQSQKNQKLAKKLESELNKYFKSLEQAFPYGGLEKIYNRNVKESLYSETEDEIEPLLAVFRATLLQRLNSHVLEVYITGQAEVISWGRTKAGIPITFEGPPIKGAVDWAEKHCAQLVTRMDDETKTRLAKIISDGIENKRGVTGLAGDIRKEFSDMSRYRSQLIAKTETRQALFQASRDNMEAMGIEGKEWVLGSGGQEGNCEDCITNASVGIIPVNEDFPTPEGDIHPG